MRGWWIALLLLVAVLGGGYWVWQQGTLPLADGGALTLSATQTGTQVQHAGSTTWAPVAAGQVLTQGDTLRTSDDGAATISFFGLGETRLSANTTIQLQHASRPYPFGSGLQIHMQLLTGEAWNRVQKLFDPDAVFSLQAGPVTASVHGTSFDLRTSSTGTVLTVAEGAVEVASPEAGSASGVPEAPIVVSGGTSVSFNGDGKLVSTKVLDQVAEQAPWYAQNVQQDGAFDVAVDANVGAFIASLGPRPLDGFAASLSALGERLHLFVAGTDAPRLSALYGLRYLAALKALSDGGKSGTALQDWSALHDDIIAQTSRPDGAATADATRHALQDAMFLLSSDMPSSQTYPLKLKTEELFIDLNQDDPVGFLHARLVGIDARLDEAEALIASSSLDDAGNALEAARQGIATIEGEFDSLPAGLSSDRIALVRAKLYVVKAREAALQVSLTTALEPPTYDIQGSGVLSATSTAMVPTSTLMVASSTTISVQNTSTILIMPVPTSTERMTTSTKTIRTTSSTTAVSSTTP